MKGEFTQGWVACFSSVFKDGFKIKTAGGCVSNWLAVYRIVQCLSIPVTGYPPAGYIITQFFHAKCSFCFFQMAIQRETPDGKQQMQSPEKSASFQPSVFCVSGLPD